MDVREKPCLSSVFDQQTLRNVMDDSLNCRENDRLCLLEDANQTALWASLEVKSKSQWDTGDSLVYHVKSLIESIDESLIESMEFLCSFLEIKKNLVSDQTTSAGSKALKPFSKSRSSLYLKGHTSKVMKTELKQNYSNDYMNSTYSIEESLFKDLCDDTFSELKIRTELQFGLSLTLSYFELALTVLKIAHKSNFYNLELTSNMLMPIENPLVFDAAFPEEYSHLIYNFSVDMNNPIPFIVNVESNNDMLVLSPSRLRALTSNHSNEHLHFLCQYYLKNHVIPEMMDVVGVKKSRRQSRPHDDCVLNDLYSKLTHLPPDADIERKPEVNLDSDSSCYSDSQYTETGCSKVNVEVDTCTFAKEHVDGELGVNSAAELNSICENSDSELSDNVNHNESNVEGLAEPYLSDKFSCSFKSCSDCSDAEPLLETCKDDQSDVNSTAEVFVSNKLELETSGKVVDKSVNNLSSETSTFEVNDMDFSEDALKVVSKLRAVLVEVGANDLAILCHDSDDIASNLFISLAFFNKGCFHQAIDYLKLTQHMLESENDYLPSVAVQSVKSLIYFYLGEAEYNLSNFSTAVHYYGESLDSHAESKFCDIPHVSESTKLEKLALALRANNQISESVAVYKRAIETSSKDVVSCHVGLGNLYHSTGSHEAALKEYEVALELAEKQNDYKSLCWINGNLGNSCFSLGMKRRGIFHLELALDLTFEHDPSPSSISRALNNLGTGYQSLGDFETAKKYFDQALCQATYGEDKIGQARAYGNIGNVCMTQKDYEQAIPHYTEVLELSNDASVVNVAYHNRGCAYYELSEAKRKQQTCEQRQEFQYVGYGPNVSEQHTIDYTDQACQSYYRLGLEDLEKVIAHHEYTFRNEQILPESADLFVSLFESNLKTFARAQDCAHILGQHHHALLLAEQSRSRTLAELMLKKNSFNLQKPLQSPLTLNQVRDIMHLQEPNVPVVVLSWTGKRLLAWILLFDGNAVTMDTFEQEPGEELFGGSSLDVFLRYSLSQMLSDDLERCGDQASKVDSVKFSSLSDEDEGCYSYTENEMHKEEGNEGKFPIEMIKNVAIPRKFLLSMKEKFLPVGVKYTDKTMKLSLAEMEEDGLTRQLKNDRELLKMSSKTKLFKLVAEPLKEIIESTEYSRGTAHGKRKIIIIPDSTTKLIPFSSLRKSDDTAFCFGDDYSLSFMPSLLTLGIMSQTPSIVITIPYDSKNILIVGDPLTPPFTIKDREWNLGPLPHAREEAEWVGHYMKSKPLLKHEPTKDVVISRLKSAKIVHLATHGSATQSFLVLAGSTYDTQSTLAISISKTMVQDEKQLLLYASDIESLSLKSALVVLSSCDSGRGVIKGGDIQGMARAFLLAGAQSVVTSLWKIPDKSGRFFMQFFYRFLLDGHSSVEALNMASCSIRAFEEFSSMIHWSGYQITGKDITIQQGSSDEERTLKKAFGRGCTAFPRLEVLKNLQKAIIDERSTDIQILCGPTDMSLTEPVIDFIVLNADHFSNGIVWINGCSEESLEKQAIMMQKIQQISLIVVDICDPALLDKAIALIQSYNQVSVVMTLSFPLDRQFEPQIGSRLIISHDISSLTNLQVTQRIVYSIQCGHHLTPGRDQQKALNYLSSMCLGSPLITDIMASYIDRCILKVEDPCEGIKLAKNTFFTAHGYFIENSHEGRDSTIGQSSIAATVLLLVKCLKTEGFLSTQSYLLLECLSLFGSLPIPQSVIVAIAEEVISFSTKETVPTNYVWDDLCSLNLLKRYPDISSSNSCDLVTKLFYLPGDWLYSEVVNNSTSLNSCCYLIHCGTSRLIDTFLSSQSLPPDSVYLLELLHSIQKFLPLKELPEDNSVSEELTVNIEVLKTITTQ